MPKGTSYRTHSTLFTLHERLEGRSIHTEYEIVAQTNTTASGTTMQARTILPRRVSLRLCFRFRLLAGSRTGFGLCGSCERVSRSGEVPGAGVRSADWRRGSTPSTYRWPAEASRAFAPPAG